MLNACVRGSFVFACVLFSFSICVAEEPSALLSVNYSDASLASVLKALAYSNGLNLVVTKDIQGQVSANLKDVTVDQALQAILSVNGYTFVREGSLIYIVPGAGLSGFAQKTVTIRLSYLPAQEAKQLLVRTISEQGDIQVNTAINSLVVTDFAQNLETVRAVLKDIDVPPLQVLIEAKILDIQAKAFENMGTTMTLTYDPGGASVGGGLLGRAAGGFNESLSVKSALGGPTSSLPAGPLTLTTTLRDYTVNMAIDALIQDNKAHLLASPSIMTLNGKEARIIIGDKVPVIEKTVTDTSTTESTRFVDVGTTLRVTPQVSPDGWITMNVHPEVSSVTANLEAGPNITTREADATIRVKDGQTIIIGGLISKQDDRISGGVPGLRSLPLLGRLFSHRSKDLQEKELTVFITPRILNTTPERVFAAAAIAPEEALSKASMVAKLMEHAVQLETEGTVEAANKSEAQRKMEALHTYKTVLSQFPDERGIDEALFRTGELSMYFKDYALALAVFERLLAEYRDSDFAVAAGVQVEIARDKKKTRDQAMDQRMQAVVVQK